MDQRNLIRIGTVLLFLLLSIYFVKYPIFKDSDLSQHEGEVILLYFTKIADSSEGGYVIEIGIEKQQVEVVTDAHFKTGEIASFYGTVKNNRLIAQKHHRHKHPNMPYYTSFIGLIGFLWLMKMEGN